MGTLDRTSLEAIGFASLGQNVVVSDRASIYGAERIHIGNNVRIDDFCVLSAGCGGIELGDHIHIAIYSSLIGAGRISLSDFCNISSRVAIYSSTDDFSGMSMTNPTVPKEFTNVASAEVFLDKHVLVGCGAVLLPGILLEEGVAIGALSLVNRSCAAFGIYAGTPAVRIKERSRNLLELERQFRAMPSK